VNRDAPTMSGNGSGTEDPERSPEPTRIFYVYRKRRWRVLFGLLDAVGGRLRRPKPGVPDLSGARSILILKLDQIGDVVLTQPLLAALHVAAPRAEVAIAVAGGRESLAAALPGADRILTYPVRQRGASLHLDPLGLIAAVRRTRALRPDVAVAAKEDPLTVLLARLSGAPVRVGFREGGLGFLLTQYLRVSGGRPQYRELSALAGPAGDWTGPPVLNLDDTSRREAENLLGSLRLPPGLPLVTVHPGSASPTTRWPWSRFAESLEIVSRSRPVAVLVIAPADLGFRPVLTLPSPSWSMISHTPLSLTGLAALLARAHAVLANDSGPAHLAAAVGTPVVVPFLSGNDPRRWGPAEPYGRAVPGAIGVGPDPGTVAEAVLDVLEDRVPTSPRGIGP